MSETSPPPATPTRPFRLAAVFCVLGGAGLVAAFFLPFVFVPHEGARAFADAVRRDLGPDITDDTPEGDFVGVFTKVAESEAIRTVDVLHYIRAVEHLEGPTAAEASAGPSPLARARRLLLLLLVTVPIAGGVLAAYALGWRFRRLGAPVLALTFPVGLLALVLPLLVAWYAPAQSDAVEPLIGAWIQLASAVTLLLVGLFGVTRRTWLAAWLGGAILTAGVVLAIWVYQVRQVAA